MAVTATHLTTGRNNPGAASQNTASITPGSNQLIIAFIDWAQAGNPAGGVATLTGNGLTWVQITNIADNSRGSAMFRAMGASPSAGAVTIAISGATPQWVGWSIVEFAGVDTTGSNGANAVVQFATNSGSATSLTVTLGAFTSVNNATMGGFGIGATDAPTVGSGFTALGNDSSGTPSMLTEWRNDNSTSVGMTKAGGDYVAGIAIEVKAAVTNTGNFFMFM